MQRNFIEEILPEERDAMNSINHQTYTLQSIQKL